MEAPGCHGRGSSRGLLQPYFRNVQIFKCPTERQWQCGYAMSYTNGSPTGCFTETPEILRADFLPERRPGCTM